MLFLSLIQWWYGDGWRRRARIVGRNLEGVIDYFSITLLLKSLFQPYRQISAGKVEGSLDTRLHALADKLISRFIGAGIRLVIIVTGLIVILLQLVLGGVILLLHALAPALPVVGLVMMLIGWTP